MDFETRLELMRSSMGIALTEIDASVDVYERLKTALSMLESLPEHLRTDRVLVSVLGEISRESQLFFDSEERLRDEASA